jgi:hypothetical protein
MQMMVGRSVRTQLSEESNLLVRRWRHVSTVIGHLQVNKLLTEENEQTYAYETPYVNICICLLILSGNNVLPWVWPSTAETCRHRRNNKLRYSVVFWRNYPPSVFPSLYVYANLTTTEGQGRRTSAGLQWKLNNCRLTFRFTGTKFSVGMISYVMAFKSICPCFVCTQTR